MNGWIVLDKPLGLSSAQGVAAIKRLLRRAGLPVPKIGHGGTLDPLATGVLPIALGEATKLAGRIARRGVAGRLVEQREQTVKTDGRAIERGQIIATHNVVLH